jgi:hypothetical protein
MPSGRPAIVVAAAVVAGAVVVIGAMVVAAAVVVGEVVVVAAAVVVGEVVVVAAAVVVAAVVAAEVVVAVVVVVGAAVGSPQAASSSDRLKRNSKIAFIRTGCFISGFFSFRVNCMAGTYAPYTLAFFGPTGKPERPILISG